MFSTSAFVSCTAVSVLSASGFPLRPPASPPERYVFQRVSAYKKNLPRYKKSQTTEYEAANAFSPEPGYFLLCFHPSCNEPAQLIQENNQQKSAGSVSRIQPIIFNMSNITDILRSLPLFFCKIGADGKCAGTVVHFIHNGCCDLNRFIIALCQSHNHHIFFGYPFASVRMMV